MRFLITGVAGTGKSTVAQELRKLGQPAFDFTDIKGLCSWRNKFTKEPLVYSSEAGKEWFDVCEYIADTDKLAEFIAPYSRVAIAGVAAGNADQYLHLFDKVILLQASPETVLQRLATRERPFGKTEVERAYVLEWQKWFDPLFVSKGAMVVSSEGATSEVVKRVLDILKPGF